jgi:amino acid permease
VLSVNAFTINILVEASEDQQTFDLGSLLAQLPGRLGVPTQVVTNIIVWLSMFLCLVGYFVVIADCALRAMKKDPEDETWTRNLVLGGAAVLVLPLCFLDQSKLALTSIFTVAVNVYVFGLMSSDYATTFSNGGLERACMLNMSKGTVAMVSTMMQCVIIQMCVLPMYGELKDRSPKKMRHITAVSFCILFLIFVAFALVGQLVYGSGVSSNVLRNLPDNAWGTGAQAAMILAIACVYPIMLMPMVAPVRNSSYKDYEGPITLLIQACSFAVAVFVNGAMSVGIFVGGVPAIVGYHFLGRNNFLMLLLAMGGLTMSVLGFVFPENYPPSNCTLQAW